MAIEPIYLTEEEQIILKNFVKKGNHNAHLITRARVILLLDRTGKKDHMRIKRTADYCNISRQAVYDIIKDYRNSNSIDEFLVRKQRKTPPIQPKITGDVEAHIIQIACSNPPEGYARWTVRMIAAEAVQLQVIESISKSSVGNILKKANISLT